MSDLTEAQRWWLRRIARHPGDLVVFFDAATGRDRWAIGMSGVSPQALKTLLALELIKLGRPIKSRGDKQIVTLTPKGRRKVSDV